MANEAPPPHADLPPISRADLKALFDYLDRQNPEPCTNTLKETAQFLHGRGLNSRPMLEWLGRNGAGCDCEVIYNVEQAWAAYSGRTSDY
jgi:hypothetical protein